MPPGASPSPRIRPAAPGDADALGAFHIASWQSAYAGLLPAAFLAGLDVGARARRWREILTGDGPSATLIAESDENATSPGVLGFVSVGWPAADEQQRTAGLLGLYVDAAQWGSGLGYRLHEAGLELIRSWGAERAELWVLRTNVRAIGFYERQGWYVDGRTQVDDHMASVELHEIGMSIDLA